MADVIPPSPYIDDLILHMPPPAKPPWWSGLARFIRRVYDAALLISIATIAFFTFAAAWSEHVKTSADCIIRVRRASEVVDLWQSHVRHERTIALLLRTKDPEFSRAVSALASDDSVFIETQLVPLRDAEQGICEPARRAGKMSRTPGH